MLTNTQIEAKVAKFEDRGTVAAIRAKQFVQRSLHNAQGAVRIVAAPVRGFFKELVSK